MTRLSAAIRQLADGDTPTKLKFRKDDFWHDAANDLKRLSERIAATSHSYEQEESSAEEAEADKSMAPAGSC